MVKNNASGHFKYACLFLLTATVVLNGCATHSPSSQPAVRNKADPYERINRKVFVFNDRVDTYVAEPIADIYRYITPQFVQTGVFNFYNNLKNLNIVVNDTLQGKFAQGAKDTGRFAINSTLGLLGVVDVAKRLGLEQNDEDFEQTLAVWGLPKGPYLVLPFLGPSTARGIPGAIFDTAANPTTYVGAPVQLLSLLNSRANAEGALRFIDEAALDPYVFTRESFLQWRRSLANDGESDIDELGFDDETIEAGTEPTPLNQAPIKLGFNAFSKKFEHISHTFSKVALSFDETSSRFENINQKIDQLKK